jgi:hypothetical protein
MTLSEETGSRRRRTKVEDMLLVMQRSNSRSDGHLNDVERNIIIIINRHV